RPDILVPLTAVIVLAAFLTPIRFKYDYYFLPCFPFLSMIAVAPFQKAFSRWENRFDTRFAGFTLILLAVLLTMPVPLAPEAFPALRKFRSFIQSTGTCQDKVLFVPGGQPYGGSNDYGIEVQFYTGRAMETSACSEASRAAQKHDIRWMI